MVIRLLNWWINFLLVFRCNVYANFYAVFSEEPFSGSRKIRRCEFTWHGHWRSSEEVNYFGFRRKFMEQRSNCDLNMPRSNTQHWKKYISRFSTTPCAFKYPRDYWLKIFGSGTDLLWTPCYRQQTIGLYFALGRCIDSWVLTHTCMRH